MPDASPWWAPLVHADRREALLARGCIKHRLRDFFDRRGFIEVECGALQRSPGNEAHLHAFKTEWEGEKREVLYLHTSPEFAAKKLLAAGETRIYEFARVFRNREQSALHAPEFTMLEWYRAAEPYSAVMADCLALVKLAAETTGLRRFSYRGRECDPLAKAERLSVAEAFSRYAEIDLPATLSPEGTGQRDLLARAAEARGHTIAADDSWSDIFSKILVYAVEPRLGIGRPTILHEYPRCEAALARASDGDPRVAERFELYICGVELANGFGELTDSSEQRRRFEDEMAEKERRYGERYPIDEEFLAALSRMPEACGVALGFDRLAMLATGSRKIDDVIWTPMPSMESG